MTRFGLAMLTVLFVAGCEDSPPALPERIGGVSRSSIVTGATAREEINRLHGKAVTPESTIIGHYGDGGAAAVLYVSVYPSSAAAEAAEFRMAGLIDRGGTAFSATRAISIQGRRMLVSSGTGQTHFFFAAGKNLYWLAAERSRAHRAAADLANAVGRE